MWDSPEWCTFLGRSCQAPSPTVHGFTCGGYVGRCSLAFACAASETVISGNIFEKQRMQQGDFRTRHGELPCRRGPCPGNHAKTPRTATATRPVQTPHVSSLPHTAQLESTDAVGCFSKRLPSAAFSSGASSSKMSATAASWSGVAASTPLSMAWRIAALPFWRVLDLTSFKNKLPEIVPELMYWPCLTTCWPCPACTLYWETKLREFVAALPPQHVIALRIEGVRVSPDSVAHVAVGAGERRAVAHVEHHLKALEGCTSARQAARHRRGVTPTRARSGSRSGHGFVQRGH